VSAAPFTALGIDVGGTKIAGGVVSFPEGRIRAQQVIPTAPARGGEAVLNDVVRLAEELAGEAKGRGQEVEEIGLGLCELVDPTGRILSTNCVRWQDLPVAERLSKVAPVVIEADVRAAALAEALFGTGRNFRIFLYVTIGTGISSCLMIDGEPFVGARGATGTMASSSMSSICEDCGHVTQRTLESISSGPALVSRLNQRRPGAAKSGADVLASAAGGNADALDVLRSAGEALGSAMGFLVNVLDPEAVIVGGGLGLTVGPYWESLSSSTRRHIWSEIQRDLPILRALTGQAGGIIGAAAAAWKKSKDLRLKVPQS
jgi:glucokinase